MTTLTTTSPIALSFNAKFDRCRVRLDYQESSRCATRSHAAGLHPSSTERVKGLFRAARVHFELCFFGPALCKV